MNTFNEKLILVSKSELKNKCIIKKLWEGDTNKVKRGNRVQKIK